MSQVHSSKIRWETNGQKKSRHKITGFEFTLYNKEARVWEPMHLLGGD